MLFVENVFSTAFIYVATFVQWCVQRNQLLLHMFPMRCHSICQASPGNRVFFNFNFNLKQIYCPTKYRIQHHGCDYMTQITTGKISMNKHTYTYVYTVTYMLNCCPTLNEMLGDTHFRPLENENGNVIDQFHWSLVQCVTRNGCHSKWTTQTDKTT